MKIPMPVIVVFLGGWLAVQGWTLTEISELRAESAALNAKLEQHIIETEHHAEIKTRLTASAYEGR